MALNPPTESRRFSRYFVDLGRLYKIKKVRVYTGLVFSLLTISFFLLFAIKPTLMTIAQLVKTIEDQRQVSQKLAEKISNLEKAQSTYNQVANQLYLVDEALPKEPSLGTLVVQLEALSAQEGVGLTSLRFAKVEVKNPAGSPTESAGEKTVAFTLTAKGDYRKLASFLDSLTRLRRLTTVNSFSLKGQKEKGEIVVTPSGEIEISLATTGQAYYLESKN